MVAVTEHTCIFIPGQAIAWGSESAPFMTTLALARRCGWGQEVHYRLYAWALDSGIICGRVDDELPPWDNLMALTPPSRRQEAVRHAFFREPQALISPDPVILNWDHSVHSNPLTYDRAGEITGGGWVTPTDAWTLTLRTLTHAGADPTAATSWRVPAGHLADLTETITCTPDQPSPSDAELNHAEDQLLAHAGWGRTHVWATQQPWHNP